jgi:hypothetical protein
MEYSGHPTRRKRMSDEKRIMWTPKRKQENDSYLQHNNPEMLFLSSIFYLFLKPLLSSVH